MQDISQDAIGELLAAGKPQLAVTIYAPMHTSASPPHITENQIRLKNLVRLAIEKLDNANKARQLSAELQSMLDKVSHEMSFWESQTPGILICAAPGMLKMFHLPTDTDEYVALDNNFHLAPVFAILNENRAFYVLTVAQHNPKLFSGDMFDLKIANVKLPGSVEVGLNIDENNQKSENQGSATGSSTNTGWFNGRGGARNPQEEDRMRFFRMVDNIVNATVDRSAPMILAGINAETTEYRNISNYPNILENTISGSHSDANLDFLHEKASKIIEKELIAPSRQSIVEEYQRLEGANPDRIARDQESILAAAEQGRIDKFMAMMNTYTKDTIRDTAAAVSKITFPEPEISRTINQLALKVWQMSGTIINLRPNEMPHGLAMAARLRY